MIEQSQLETIADFVSSQVLSDALVPQLKKAFPDLHFTYCMDEDVYGAQPTLKKAGFNMYLIDSTQHCLALTRDAETASGVLVAETEYM